MVTVWHAAKRHRFVHPLGGETRSHQFLRGAVAVTPQTAALTRGGQVMLTGSGLPSARTGFEFAHLHHPRHVRFEAHDPVVAIARQIQDAPTFGQVVLCRVQHGLGVILGVGAIDHGFVGLERIGAFMVQVFVGHNFVVVAHFFQPRNDRQIGRELPGPGHAGHAALGPHVDDGAAP